MNGTTSCVLESSSQIGTGLIEELDANAIILPYENDELNEFGPIEDLGSTTNIGDEAFPQICTNNFGAKTPRVGMQFFMDDEAYEFYNLFAKSRGFAVRKSASAKGKNGDIVRKLFVCNKQGFKSLNDKREVGREVKRRKLLEREGCLAKLVIRKSKDGVWEISSFDDNHNHILLQSPNKIATLRSHNKAHLDPICKATIEQYYDCGVRPSVIAKIINATVTDASMKITAKQCIENLREKRNNNIGQECWSMIQQFIERQVSNYQFYYAVEMDEDRICRSIFWADGRARMSYLQFSDVVVFDVTYRTNSFLLPFAPFTGVNHHNQSTLFGCALLADEREETFIWLFEHWLKCMWGKSPGAIITDQDPAIRNAIKKVFPHTLHRYCIWHITLHENEHLQSLRSLFNPIFDEDYNKWARKSMTIEESENCWMTLNMKYKRSFKESLTDKQKNEVKAWDWLQDMYSQRHHWVEAYLKNTFFAGMRSSQRSESMNSFFDNYVNAMTPLSKFSKEYDRALASRREKEEKEDTFCMRMKHNFDDMHELEAFAGKVYTRNLFDKFREEFKGVIYCRHEREGISGEFIIYKVISRIKGEVRMHTVKCNITEQIFLCVCANFETQGILCKHILYIMKQELDLQTIPDHYILSRWTLNARHCSTRLGYASTSSQENRGGITLIESSRFRVSVNKMVEKALQDRNLYNMSLKFLETFWIKSDSIEETQATRISGQNTQVGSITSSVLASLPSNFTVYDPKKSTHKGRPRVASRIPFGIQVSQEESHTRKRTCGVCGEKGHDMRTCKKNMATSSTREAPS